MGGDNFIRPWGAFNFHMPLGRLSQMAGLKSFTLLGGQGFLYWRDGRSPSPTNQKLTHPYPTRKSPLSRLTPKFLFTPTNVHPPH